MPEVKLPLAVLYEKTSAAGRRYFVGRLGRNRILLFRDERTESADPVWTLFLQPVEDAAGNGAWQKPEAAPERPQRPRRSALRRAAAAQAPHGGQGTADAMPFNDSLDDLP